MHVPVLIGVLQAKQTPTWRGLFWSSSGLALPHFPERRLRDLLHVTLATAGQHLPVGGTYDLSTAAASQADYAECGNNQLLHKSLQIFCGALCIHIPTVVVWRFLASLAERKSPALGGAFLLQVTLRPEQQGSGRLQLLHGTQRSGRNSGSGTRPLPLCRFSSRRPCIPQQLAVCR
jgi:hypothetical protein